MFAPSKDKIRLSELQEQLLRKHMQAYTTPKFMQERIAIILSAALDKSNNQLSKDLQLSRPTIIKWRHRWRQAQQQLQEIQSMCSAHRTGKHQLLSKMLEVLTDAPRSGKPISISLAAKQQIRLMACRLPEDYGLPHEQWSGELLRQTAIEHHIVEQISTRYVNVLLKKTIFDRT